MSRRTIIDGRYELDPNSRRRGGMGEVWFGHDKRLDRKIAIKFIRIDKLPDGKPDPELTQRFVRESRITARLEHPGVPAVYDCGTQGHDLYLVMQLIDGCSVSDLLAEVDEVPVAWAAAIAAQACSVLAAAHARSLVHRDLKPGNLMLCRDGTVKVLDFGIAAALSPTATRLTRTGVVVGTPEYMAPEQAMTGATSPQSDLYSLGVVLDEMLTRRNQFAGSTVAASWRNHMELVPRPLRMTRRDVPEGLERLVLWLLAKPPDKRPPSAEVVYERLLHFCRELPPFAGFVDTSDSHPLRMYAAVVGRITANGVRVPVPDGNEPVRSPVPEAVAVRHSDIALARKDADALKAESRFSQAAEVLAQLVEPATRTFGPTNADVVELRIELADVLFLGGDYRRAAVEFATLAADLAERDRPDNHLVLRFRLMEANCHAAAGETTLALDQLGRLLEDEKRFGVDEDRLLELRRQIGLLELGAGHLVQARKTLMDLLPDLERRYGPRHPGVIKVRGILDGLDGDR
ncbi:serine/threonine protein kinase [Planotetraspora sp. A-T 1434]|uniref:serine/threonine-protein kinase n=1 Tax=Planotetraspora sp. A-T 1434 TaxID=2979219 RepID=UPI0021C08241|nr:serine/threonine-protein kinase [Planotetraspora sp. A-T 1434]MCT9932235.1 serine/threonine protein kinase [Planotetraspora sp. A-T 1434]